MAKKKRKSHLVGRQFKYIKIGMYILTVMVGVLGLVLGGVGLWVRVDFEEKTYRQVIDPVFQLCATIDEDFEFSIDAHMDSIAYFLIFLGVTIFCVGVVGTCGTVKERQTYIGIFSILLFLVFAVLLTAGIQSMEKKDAFQECQKDLTQSLHTAVLEYDEVLAQSQFMDTIQGNVRCCGASNGVADYGERLIPDSCLKNATDENSTEYYTTGCDSALKSFFGSISENMLIILVVSASLGLITIFGIGMSGYLFVSIRHAKR